MFCSSVLFIFFSPSFANLTLFYLSTKSGKEQYSGVTQIIEHEIAHSFFVDNLNSPGDPYHTSNGLMVGVDAAAYNMSPYERSRSILSWNINPISVGSTGTYTLRDYVSTGDMLRIPIPGSSTEAFWIANHQKVSKYDGEQRGGKQCWDINYARQDPYCPYGKGLIIYHESPGCANNFSKPIDLEQADGKWYWQLDRWVPYYFPLNFCIPLFEHQVDGGNPFFGKGEYLQEIMYITNPPACWGGARWWAQEVTDNRCSENPNDYFTTIDNVGDGIDGYNMGYCEIFSPYSNPATNSCQNPNANTGITVKLLGEEEDGRIFIKIYFDDNIALSELPPAKPMNLKVTKFIFNQSTGAFHPSLTWDSNREPDFINGNGYYKIYRGVNTDCNIEPIYSLFTIASSFTNQYIDGTVILYTNAPGSIGCTGPYLTYSYKIEAVDNIGLYSLRSDRGLVSGYQNLCEEHENPLLTNNENPTSFSLSQNFPNPFNPTTQIKFALPQNTFVSVKVYNITGELVATLVNNEYRNAGYYDVAFDGTNLASGIYFYKIEAGSFVETKKMVLVK